MLPLVNVTFCIATLIKKEAVVLVIVMTRPWKGHVIHRRKELSMRDERLQIFCLWSRNIDCMNIKFQYKTDFGAMFPVLYVTFTTTNFYWLRLRNPFQDLPYSCTLSCRKSLKWKFHPKLPLWYKTLQSLLPCSQKLYCHLRVINFTF